MQEEPKKQEEEEQDILPPFAKSWNQLYLFVLSEIVILIFFLWWLSTNFLD